jgi:high-affinity Fe2+/Pb2+ permease
VALLDALKQKHMLPQWQRVLFGLLACANLVGWLILVWSIGSNSVDMFNIETVLHLIVWPWIIYVFGHLAATGWLPRHLRVG